MKRTPINKMSTKRKSDLKQRAIIRQYILDRDENRCQCGLEQCTRHATDVHELKSRARGGDWLYDSTNMISLCRSCHSWITEHPKWATENGFMMSATADDADYRAAERARLRFYWGEETIVVDDESA